MTMTCHIYYTYSLFIIIWPSDNCWILLMATFTYWAYFFHSSLWWQRHIIKWNHLLSGSPWGVPQLSGLRVERESPSWTWDLHQLYRPEHGAYLWLHHCLVGIHCYILSIHWQKKKKLIKKQIKTNYNLFATVVIANHWNCCQTYRLRPRAEDTLNIDSFSVLTISVTGFPSVWLITWLTWIVRHQIQLWLSLSSREVFQKSKSEKGAEAVITV